MAKLCWLVLAAIGNAHICVWSLPFMLDKTIKMDRFLGQCPGQPHMPVYFGKTHFTPVRRMYLISTHVSVERNLTSKLKFRKTVRFDRFLGRCPGHPNTPFYFDTVHLIRKRGTFYITTNIIAPRDATSNLKVLLELERCKSKEALDSCEPYPDVNIKNICDLVTARFQPWTPFIKSLHPDFSCPVKKGIYTSTNGTFDGGAFLALPVEDWYWKIHAKVFETVDKESTMVMCLYLEGQIVNI